MNWLTQFPKKTFTTLVILVLLFGLGNSAYAENNYEMGVGYYRAGQFEKAESLFQKLVDKEPNNISAIYYLAISEVQLGHVDIARAYYNQVLQLAHPDSDLAKLAQQGLAYLPATQHIDAPPKPLGAQTPQAYGTPTPVPALDTSNLPGYPQQLPGAQAGQKAVQDANAMMGNNPASPQSPAPASNSLLDPKMMEMMMMMSAMGGGGGNNSNSFMMLPMMQEMMQRNKTGGQGASDSSSESGFKPEMIQQMMLQNMMPNIDNLFNKDKDN